MQLDEPIEVKAYEWNTGGLLTRIEAIKKLLSFIFFTLVINSYTVVLLQIRCKICFDFISGAESIPSEI
jgi:small subunit ribosomal protein S1